jgi:hypothetical protein
MEKEEISYVWFPIRAEWEDYVRKGKASKYEEPCIEFDEDWLVKRFGWGNILFHQAILYRMKGSPQIFCKKPLWIITAIKEGRVIVIDSEENEFKEEEYSILLNFKFRNIYVEVYHNLKEVFENDGKI